MKKLLSTLMLMAPLALVFTLLTAPAAHADDRRCVGTIGARHIDGNVIVPKGKTCRLIGTRVDGDVKVYRGATLLARGVRVEGNVQASAHRRVELIGRTVNTTIRRSFVDGNIQLKSGRGGIIGRTTVNGDIQLFSNNGRFTVRHNRVDGNLQCKSNRPAPVGKNNVVKGNKENQCRRL